MGQRIIDDTNVNLSLFRKNIDDNEDKLIPIKIYIIIEREIIFLLPP